MNGGKAISGHFLVRQGAQKNKNPCSKNVFVFLKSNHWTQFAVNALQYQTCLDECPGGHLKFPGEGGGSLKTATSSSYELLRASDGGGLHFTLQVCRYQELQFPFAFDAENALGSRVCLLRSKTISSRANNGHRLLENTVHHTVETCSKGAPRP